MDNLMLAFSRKTKKLQGEIKMKNRLNILITIFICLAVQLDAQTFDLEKYNEEKEKILNVVINGVQFDSIYSHKRVYFVANELLSEESPLVLKRKYCKVKIRKREDLIGKNYVALGDFTMDRNNPTHVRVQLEVIPSETLLNLSLEKKNDKWEIVNHLIMKE